MYRRPLVELLGATEGSTDKTIVEIKTAKRDEEIKSTKLDTSGRLFRSAFGTRSSHLLIELTIYFGTECP